MKTKQKHINGRRHRGASSEGLATLSHDMAANVAPEVGPSLPAWSLPRATPRIDRPASPMPTPAASSVRAPAWAAGRQAASRSRSYPVTPCLAAPKGYIHRALVVWAMPVAAWWAVSRGSWGLRHQAGRNGCGHMMVRSAQERPHDRNALILEGCMVGN